MLSCGDQHRAPPLADDEGAGGTGGGGAGGAPWKSLRSGLVASVPLGLYESEPHLARGPSGELAAVFISLAGRRSVALTTSTDDGASWSPLSLLEDPEGREGVDPAVAFDSSGGLAVVFLGLRYDSNGNRSDRRVFLVRAPSVAGPLSPPETIDDGGGGGEDLDKPWITTLPGGLLLTWTSDSGSWVRTAHSSDGATWTRSTIAPDGQLRALAYPCAGSSSQVYVTYLTPAGVFVSSSEDGGVSFPMERTARASAEGEQVAFLPPSCVADGAQVWVTYGTQASPGTELQAALAAQARVVRSSDGGHTFGSPRVALAGTLLNPQITREETGRLVVVAYAKKGSSAGEIKASISGDGGANFEPPSALWGPLLFDRSRTGFGWLGDYLGLSMNGGTLRVVLVDNATQPGATLARVRFLATTPP